ncbi:hypothetical protein D9758_012842 [Tetrapyrgos nigripes]|uniref:Uncharacterized protein n=1 Tax=Tetrapyrgos nigripes TaxID=182062 RepID=A0A8H5FJ28_9AGAR|nr:hypothetical protein D9758_012842 [Tetrapyrgos nigripes]
MPSVIQITGLAPTLITVRTGLDIAYGDGNYSTGSTLWSSTKSSNGDGIRSRTHSNWPGNPRTPNPMFALKELPVITRQSSQDINFKGDPAHV